VTRAFEVAGSRSVYEGVLSNVRIDTLRAPDGDEFPREIVEHLDAVAVVALTPDGEVVLVEQYRHPVGRTLLELPAGMCDVDGEDPVETAVRELAEETSLVAYDYTLLTTMHNSAGWTDETTRIYLARGAHASERPDGFVLEHEEAAMEVVRIPLTEAVAAVRDGEISDAKTIVGLLLAASSQGH
jgi:8-oxo-dGDP phosphatase